MMKYKSSKNVISNINSQSMSTSSKKVKYDFVRKMRMINSNNLEKRPYIL